jgi:hypothetical protein
VGKEGGERFIWKSHYGSLTIICSIICTGNLTILRTGRNWADPSSFSNVPSSSVVQSEISSPRVDDLAEEMLLAALHHATDHEPDKHREALSGILPELESDEKQYFLNVITDLKGYTDDAFRNDLAVF